MNKNLNLQENNMINEQQQWYDVRKGGGKEKEEGEEEKEIKENVKEMAEISICGANGVGNGNEKVRPKMNFINTMSRDSNSYRSVSVVNEPSSGKSGFASTIKYVDSGVDAIEVSKPFLMSSKNIANVNYSNDERICDKIGNTSQDVEMIDIGQQNMEECGMAPCKVFVECAMLEPLDEEIELLVPEWMKEEPNQRKLSQHNNGNKTLQGLKVNDTSCVAGKVINDCMRLVPLTLARVSDDIHLKLAYIDENNSHHIPKIEGCVMSQHKPIIFAVHFYEYPHDQSDTVIEFQRRSGDMFLFQKFYSECLEQLANVLPNLRSNDNRSTFNDWNCLPALTDLSFDGLQSNICLWDKDALDTLANSITDENQEAVEMLGSLCEQLKEYTSLQTQFLQHQTLMKQIISKVLTHQDQCFVNLGLVVLDTSLRGQKVDVIKSVLKSYPILAFVIGLLNCESMFVLRRAVRLLSFLSIQCDCPWKLNESQKQALNNCIGDVQHNLLETHAWSAIYATESFVTQDMFQRIALHCEA